MKQLERDKVELQGQLRDLEWRLDNESKVGWHFILFLYETDLSNLCSCVLKCENIIKDEDFNYGQQLYIIFETNDE